MEFSDIIWFCGIVFILIYVVKPVLQLIIVVIFTALGIYTNEKQKKSTDFDNNY